MRSKAFILSLTLFSFVVCLAQNRERVNKVMTEATWVYVTSDRGGDDLSPRTPIEDREAIQDLRAALKRWGHYRLANRLENADLILVIHREGEEPTLSPNRTLNRGEFGNGDDSLFVYQAQQYPNGGALWKAAAKDGLKSPRLPLFQQLKEQIDDASSAKKTKP